MSNPYTKNGQNQIDELDLGDVLEDMTNYSGKDADDRERSPEQNPFEGLSDAEKVAKAIELAEQKKPDKSEERETAVQVKRRKKSGSDGRLRKKRHRKKRTGNTAAARRKLERQRKVQRNRRMIALIAVIALAAASIVIWYTTTHHIYHTYSVVKQEKRTDNVSSYECVDGYILRYSTEGASLLDQDFEGIWNESFTMDRPRADICGSQILIYDQRGTSVCIYNTKGKVSEFSTAAPILKAVISNEDSVAMLLQNGDNTEFSYCDAKGSAIAGGQSSMSGTGYPADLALSPNGEGLTLAFLRIEGSSVSTTLNFYNFGKAGQGKKNNLVGSDKLTGTIVPEVYYLTNRRMAAVRDNGFSIYEGTSSISEVNHVDFSRDIVSSFHDASHLAFCFSADSENAEYELQTYSGTGKLISSTDLDEAYQKAEVSGNQIVFYGPSGIDIRNMNGFLRYSGQVKAGSIGDVLKVGRNRYLIVTDQTMEIVKLR